MPSVWCSGITVDRGLNAGYRAGHNRMEVVKLHYTAGAYSGDYSVGKAGFFQVYIPRDYPAVQFAEIDALCWDSGSFNDEGPGIEFEKLHDGIELTEMQLHWGRIVFTWLAEWGFSPSLYDTGGDNSLRVRTVPPGYSYINHRALDQVLDNHIDYISDVEFAVMTQENDMAITVYSVRDPAGNEVEILQSTGGAVTVRDPTHVIIDGKAPGSPAITGWDYFCTITQDDADRMLQRGRYAPGGVTGSNQVTGSFTLTGQGTLA